MNRSTPRRLLDFVTRRLRLQRYLRDPGDGRRQPQIPAKALLWSLLIGQVLRACSFLAVERLVRSSARRALAVSRPFSEYAAGQRLLRRAIERLGVRFAAYVVVDGEFATAPFLHTAGDLGLPIVARLKAN